MTHPPLPVQAAADVKPPLTRVAIGVGFLVLCLTWMLNAMDRQVFYPLLPEIREDFDFSLQEAGLLATGFNIGLAVAGFIAGFMVDRYPRKYVIIFSVVVYSLGTFAIPFAQGFYDMSVYRIISGVGEGVQATALYAIIGSFFFHRRAFAAGFVGVAFGGGIFLGPLVGVPLAIQFENWRAPFILFGLLGIAMAVIVLLLVSRRMTEAKAGHGNTAAQGDYSHVPANPYNRNTLGFGIACLMGGSIFSGFLGFYPTFLRQELGFEPSEAAVALSMSGLGAMMALPAGWLGDRINQRWLIAGAFASTSVIGYLSYNVVRDLEGQYILAFLMGTFASGFLFTNISTAMQRSVRPENIGRGQGVFMLAYYVAAAFSGLIFAKFVEAWGWGGAGFVQLSLFPLVGVAAMLIVQHRRMIGHKTLPATPVVGE